tara:strand:+ start:3585 stop:4838 length:1254 start_codon:yes stop_codon:yes gene_type:complete
MIQPSGPAFHAVSDGLDPARDAPLGVAVSGGSDSVALLYLLRDWAAATGAALHVVTVDHGLRAGSAEEAEFVASIAEGMALPHQILRWQGWDGAGNLPDRARRARYDLIADWAAQTGVAAVALGHTADDIAETFLMRLARGSGADGLAAMSARRLHRGTPFLRPMLSLRRHDLREMLTRRGQSWIDDPTNVDPRYTRARIRQALPDLADLGLTVEALTLTARNLSDMRATLGHYADRESRELVQIEGDEIVIPRDRFVTLPAEIARRILQTALIWTSGADYPPRRDPLARLLKSLEAGQGMPLSGCLVEVTQGNIRISREPAAVATCQAEPGEVWDGRWRLTGPAQPGDEVRALGEAGLRACPGWREGGLRRNVLLASPAVWRGDALIAAPLARRPEGWRATLIRDQEVFDRLLRAH